MDTASIEATKKTAFLAVAAFVPAAAFAAGIDWLRFNVAPRYLLAPLGFIGAAGFFGLWIGLIFATAMATARECNVNAGGK